MAVLKETKTRGETLLAYLTRSHKRARVVYACCRCQRLHNRMPPLILVCEGCGGKVEVIGVS